MTTRVLEADEIMKENDIAIYSEEQKEFNLQNPNNNEFVIKGLAGRKVKYVTDCWELVCNIVAVIREE